MIKLDTSYSNIKNKPTKIKIDVPLFAQYTTDFDAIERVAKKYKSVKNIIVLGNGGSATSFHFYYTALGTTKKVYLVSSMEPDLLYDVSSRCNKKDTVVVMISKSGTNIGIMESFLYFFDYPNIVIITENKKSALGQIQEKYGFDFIEHPPIGGRYSGFTPSGLLPAAICGIDIRGIWKGASKGYKKYSPRSSRNSALDLANIFYGLDKKGYCEIFMPVYSSRLIGSKYVITQLLHESVGKERKGQTVVIAAAPESQHHTNQRFFGGKKNMLGCFVVVDQLDRKHDIVKVPQNLRQVRLRDGTMEVLNNNLYSRALHAEFIGTREDAIRSKIPNVVVHVKSVTPEAVGEYLAFWHYVTVYLCTLNGVNPFNQPEVEYSKKISFEFRKKARK